MDIQLLMKTAALAGGIMLKSGAETYRVEDTMTHILKTADHLEDVEVLVIMTGIVATLKVEGMDAVTTIKRVPNRSTKLGQIVEVNQISRKYCAGKMELNEAYKELEEIEARGETFRLISFLAVAGICIGFTIFFGGSIYDVFAATIVGAGLVIALILGDYLKLHAFITDVIASITIALLSMFLSRYIGVKMSLDAVIISCIMPLVPGVAITNAVRDTLQGDYLSGVARILEAFLKAAGIALGIGLGLYLGKICF